MTHTEREFRRAEIERVLLEIGAVPAGAYEPRESCVFLTSIENRFAGGKGGVTMQVGKRQAAVLIVDNTHRLATEDEIDEYHQGEANRKQAASDLVNREARRVVIYTEPPAIDEAPAPVDEAPQLELEPVTAEPKRKKAQ